MGGHVQKRPLDATMGKIDCQRLHELQGGEEDLRKLRQKQFK